jgi:hypothetical protein
VAIVTQSAPIDPSSGHGSHLAGIIAALAGNGSRVTVLAVGPRCGFLVRRRRKLGYDVVGPGLSSLGPIIVQRPRGAIRDVGWKIFERAPAWATRIASAARDRRRRSRGVDHVLGRFLDEPTLTWVGAQLVALAPDTVLSRGIFAALPAQALPPTVRRTAVICDDLIADRAAALHQSGYRTEPPELSEQTEVDLIDGFDIALAIQWDEAAKLKRQLRHAEVVVAPITFPKLGLQGSGRDRSGVDPVPGRCLFVGTGSLHNVDGLRWFLDEVWPVIRGSSAGASLDVAGTVRARFSGSYPAVRFLGPVASSPSPTPVQRSS